MAAVNHFEVQYGIAFPAFNPHPDLEAALRNSGPFPRSAAMGRK